MQSRCSIDVVILHLRSCGGGVEKLRLKLASAKVEVEVESELGNSSVVGGGVVMLKKKAKLCSGKW